MLVSVVHDFSLFPSERYPKKEELGTFLVEKCEAGKESYTPDVQLKSYFCLR